MHECMLECYFEAWKSAVSFQVIRVETTFTVDIDPD